MQGENGQLPLEGIRVLDFTLALNGPYGVRLLGTLGAEVVHLERPGGMGPKGSAPPFAAKGVSFMEATRICFYGNKEITLNVRMPKGREIFKELIKHFDVLMDNYAPGTLEKAGLPWEEIHRINPRLIYGTTVGFGYTPGPYRDLPAYDAVAQSMTGVVDVNGLPERPIKTSVAWTDFGGGTHLALAVIAALIRREITGEGSRVDIGQYDVAVATLMEHIPFAIIGEKYIPWRRLLNRHPTMAPHNAYKTRDDKYVAIACITTEDWKNTANLIGKPDWASDRRFQTVMGRVVRVAEIDDVIAKWVAGRSREEAVEQCSKANVPCVRVQMMDEMLDDPYVKARNMIVEVEHVTAGKTPGPGSCFKTSEWSGRIGPGAPLAYDESNEEIYGKLLGLSKEELQQLKAEGVV